ncbi:hypothetical protein ACJ73_03251 [Blastomyces percursus]|uniref:Uncharacterized protein n=1 Tax=Blastomyces percursus TaxID=1658174 RepID=A0A1J9Q9A1_9EURO|nr:hypothetical protein ACJ73_03251 [Blastomyces percursus]
MPIFNQVEGVVNGSKVAQAYVAGPRREVQTEPAVQEARQFQVTWNQILSALCVESNEWRWVEGGGQAKFAELCGLRNRAYGGLETTASTTEANDGHRERKDRKTATVIRLSMTTNIGSEGKVYLVGNGRRRWVRWRGMESWWRRREVVVEMKLRRKPGEARTYGCTISAQGCLGQVEAEVTTPDPADTRPSIIIINHQRVS